MKVTLARFVGAIAISVGLSSFAWGQQAPPPGPLPSPTPLPPPTAADPNLVPAPAPGGIIVSPGSIGSGNSCSPCPIIPGGCLDGILPHFLCGTWVAGGGIYFIAPVYNNNPAYATSKVAVAGGVPTTTNSQTNFSTKIGIAPTAFAGYMWDNGLGIRFRWMQISQDNSTGTTLDGATAVTDAGGQRAIIPPAGSVANAGSHLFLSAYDLEATYLTICGQWTLLGSAGVRYAQINQGYGFSATDAAVPGTFLTSATNHNFAGAGPTVSLEGHRDLCFCGLGVYATARGSILFGSGDINSVGSAGLAGVGAAAIAGSASQTNVIPVGEIEIGGEWHYAWGRLRFFAQVGVVGQCWWGAGNPSYGLYLNGPNVSSGGSPSNLGFIGGVARAGVVF